MGPGGVALGTLAGGRLGGGLLDKRLGRLSRRGLILLLVAVALGGGRNWLGLGLGLGVGLRGAVTTAAAVADVVGERDGPE